MEFLAALDTNLFLWINHWPHTVLSDAVALFFSGIGASGIIWMLLGIVLFLREETKDHLFFVPLVVGLASAVSLVELLLKPLVARPRPDMLMGAMLVADGIGGYSFPSGHAVIAWTMATILSRYEPRWSRWFAILAAVISLSRIYLGKHYPFDVVAGTLIGWSLGTIIIGILRPATPKPSSRKRHR
jgi:undecaprenyl-diphosphatase